MTTCEPFRRVALPNESTCRKERVTAGCVTESSAKELKKREQGVENRRKMLVEGPQKGVRHVMSQFVPNAGWRGTTCILNTLLNRSVIHLM